MIPDTTAPEMSTVPTQSMERMWVSSLAPRRWKLVGGSNKMLAGVSTAPMARLILNNHRQVAELSAKEPLMTAPRTVPDSQQMPIRLIYTGRSVVVVITAKGFRAPMYFLSGANCPSTDLGIDGGYSTING